MKYDIEKIKNTILCGDCLEELKKLPDDSVDTIVTSPPYWGLRDYGVKGQIGLEKTLEEYIKKLLDITAELKRVLKLTGVMFWNHGDCYGGIKMGKTDKKVSDYVKDTQKNLKKVAPAYTKCLMLQNYRLILQMIDHGWMLRNTVIWHKPNHMPSSVKDRFANAYEPVFMLTKNKKYWFDLDAVRRKSISGQQYIKGSEFEQRFGEPWDRFGNKTKKAQTKIPKETAEQYGSPRARQHRGESQKILKERGIKATDIGPTGFDHNLLNNPAGKNPGDVWKIPTAPFPEAHFATFPQKLIEPMVKSSCPQWICKECGKARVRISEGKNIERIISKGNKARDKRGQAVSDKSTMGGMFEYKTLGWTDCKCKAGWQAGIVLDPFMGSGTTALVAQNLGRNYIGIEISPEYIKIANKRLAQKPML